MAKKKFISVADTPAIQYWDYERNTVSPTEVAQKSGKKRWWICPECGQPHEKVPLNQQKSPRCKACGQKASIASSIKTHFAKAQTVDNHPVLLQHWDSEGNKGIDPSTIPIGVSDRKYRWICSKCGTSFERTPYNEQKSTLCQKCGHRKGLDNGYKTRVAKSHSIADDSLMGPYWDYERNMEDPAKLAYRCNRKFSWICPECGHPFERTASHMVDGQLCNDCTLKKRAKTHHDNYMQNALSVADDPELLKGWDYDRNTAAPHDVPQKSNDYYYWKCLECGTSYRRTGNNQYASLRLCNKCADKVKLASVNEWRQDHCEKVSDRPNMMAQWDTEKNEGIDPSTILAHSTTAKYWWRCPVCGKPEQTTPDKKYESKTCWDCGNKIGGQTHRKTVVALKGSFGDQHPHLAKEWHPTMNGDVTPYDITSGCSDYFYWQCKYGHVFHTSPAERVKRHAGCPTCRMSLRTSFTEQAIAFYLSKTMEVKQHHKEGGFNFDIYIPSLKSIVEYDGMFWHAKEETAKRDKRKDKFCKDQGWRIIRVKESEKINKVDGNRIYAQRRNTDYVWLISEVCKQLGILPPVDIDIERDTPEIYSRVNPVGKTGSLQEKKPALIRYWNYEANSPVKPDMVTPFSHLAFSWRCPDCGHEWTQKLIEISDNKNPCPKCREKAFKEKGLNAKGQFIKGKSGK